MNEEVAKLLPPLYSNEEKNPDSVMAPVKFFTPDSNWTWYAVEYDPDEGLFFGLVDGFEVEFGYFSLMELESVTGPLGLHIERDLYWSPRPVHQIRMEIDEQRRQWGE